MALTEAEVKTYYQAILQREPTDAQLAVAMATGTADTLISALIDSNESQSFVFPLIQVYQAVFGRVPDADGLDFWVDQYRGGLSLEAITEGFVASEEFEATYGEGLTDGSDPAFIQALYLNVLGRPGEAAGIAFWTSQTGISPAEVVRLFAIDAEFTNKAAAPIVDFLTDAANGVENTGSLFADFPDIGKTFTLTAGVDGPGAVAPAIDTTGTDANDTYNAIVDAGTPANSTLTIADAINAAGGEDALNVRTVGAVALSAANTPVLNGIEVLNVTALTGATSANLTGIAPNLTTVASTASNAAVTVTNAARTVSTIELANIAADNADLSVTYLAGNTGTADALQVNVSNNGAATPGTAANFAAISATGAAAGDGFDNVTVSSTGGASRLDSLTVTDSAAASTMRTLTIEGDANLRINTALDFAGTSGTLNAANFTGNLNVGFGAEDITVTGGAGNDRFDFGGNFNAQDVVNGGAGRDTLAISTNVAAVAAFNAALNAVQNVEVLELTQAGAALNASAVTFTNDFVFSGGGATAVTGVANDDSFTFGASAGATTFAPSLDGGANVLNLGTTGGVTVTSVAAGTFETANISSTGGSANAITTLAMNNNATVNITGSQALTTTITGTNTTVNASTFSGDLTVTTGAGNDSIVTGTGDNTINAGNGIDNIDISAGGNNMIDLSGVTAAADRDIITGFDAGSGSQVDTIILNSTAGDQYTAANYESFSGSQVAFTFAATTDLVEFSFLSANNGADLSAATDGTELLKAIAVQGSTVTGITTAAADTGHIIAYQGSNAYLYSYDAGAGDSTVSAGEITLIGVLNNIEVGALTIDNFA